MSAPVFFDPTGRRSRVSRRMVAVLMLVVVLAAAAFATTLMVMPRRPDLRLPLPLPHAAAARGDHRPRGLAAWLPHHRSAAAGTALSIGFYEPGNDGSLASLRRNGGALDWVVPALVTVAGPRHTVTVAQDGAFDRTLAAMRHPPRVLPMVQNFGDDDWDGAGAAALLADRTDRRLLVDRLAAMVAARKAGGLVMDFEALPAAAMRPYLDFLRQLHAAMPAGTSLAVTAPAEDERWPLAALAGVSDKLIFMAYDQHWEGGSAGPIA